MKEDYSGNVATDVYRTHEYGEYSGNRKQECLVVTDIPKSGIDERFYGMYETLIDARIYASATATEFTQIESTWGTAEL